MTTHNKADSDAQASIGRGQEAADKCALTNAEENAVTDQRTDERGRRGIGPATAHAKQYGEQMQHIRQRVADGVYNNSAIVALVARRIVDSGDLG